MVVVFCDSNSYIRSLLQRSTRWPDSEEQLEGQPCELSFSTLRSPVSTLLLSCVPGGGLKSSEAGAAIIEEGAERSDDLLGAVSKLSLCPSTRSAVGVCSKIRGGRECAKFGKTSFRSRFSKSLGFAHGPLPAE